MKKGGHDAAESVLKELDENHQKYKFMELNLLSRKKRQAAVMIYCFFFLNKHNNFRSQSCMINVDAVKKLETFVWILNHV